MKKFLSVCLLLSRLLVQPATALAAGVALEGLYRAAVPVTSQDAGERRQALNTALFDVLVKVTGQPRSRLVEVLGATVDDPVRFVQQYRYDTRLTPEGDGARGLSLGVDFDKSALDALVRNAGLPVWGRVRPTTTLWLAEETGDGRHLVSADERRELWAVVREQAAQRGIPVVIPLFDIEDQVNLTPADVWGGFGDSIRSASRRYGSDLVLVGRLYRGAAGLAESSWLLYQGDAESGWVLREGSHGSQVAEAVSRLSDTIAREFAVAGGPGMGPGELEVAIAGLSDLERYGRLMTYLEGVESLDEVTPVHFEGDRVTLRLRTALSREQVVRSLTLGQVLRPVASEGDLLFELAP